MSQDLMIPRTWRLAALMALLALGVPLWRWLLNRRLRRGKESPQSVAQKLMQIKPPQLPSSARLIWGHAVGVGELLALVGLFRRLDALLPGHHFLLTSSSLTSGQAVERQKLPSNFHHQFAPIDHPKLMAQFLDAWRPASACFSETDLWPHMLICTQKRSIPMLLLNARMDELKADAWQRKQWFYQPLMQCFDRVYPQNTSSLHHIQSLNWSLALSPYSGNIKALAPALHVDAQQLSRWQAHLAQRPVWLLASSHEGEEALAFEAHQQLLREQPQALLIVVPRDAFRGVAIQVLAQSHSWACSLRSHTDLPLDHEPVYVADTMGELGLWYALSSIACLGGSFVPIGGHNPYEASAAHCHVLHGPYIHNFTESYEALQARKLATAVQTTDDLVQRVQQKWSLLQTQKTASYLHEPPRLAEALLDDVLRQLPLNQS
jgi:3-deoxy-D-manno-octulosonic-acid transferase